MARFPIQFLAGLFGAAACAAAWQGKVNTGSWSGIIINGGCTADEAFAESDKCFERRGSQSRLTLYDDTIRQVFDLDAQDQAERYLLKGLELAG